MTPTEDLVASLRAIPARYKLHADDVGTCWEAATRLADLARQAAQPDRARTVLNLMGFASRIRDALCQARDSGMPKDYDRVDQLIRVLSLPEERLFEAIEREGGRF